MDRCVQTSSITRAGCFRIAGHRLHASHLYLSLGPLVPLSRQVDLGTLVSLLNRMKQAPLIEYLALRDDQLLGSILIGQFLAHRTTSTGLYDATVRKHSSDLMRHHLRATADV